MWYFRSKLYSPIFFMYCPLQESKPFSKMPAIVREERKNIFYISVNTWIFYSNVVIMKGVNTFHAESNSFFIWNLK